MFRGAVFFIDQEFGAIYKIGEGILFGEELSVLIPRSSHIFAAAHMGNGKNKTSVQKA